MSFIGFNNQNFLALQKTINIKNMLNTNRINENLGSNDVENTNDVDLSSNSSNNISDKEKLQILQEIRIVLREKDEKWGVKNWNLNNNQIEYLYNRLISDATIKTFSGTKEDFEKLIKVKLVVLYSEMLSSNVLQNFRFISTMKSETLQTFEDKIISGEFNKEVTKDETTKYINQYAEFIKSDLKKRYNYSDSYLDNIINVATENIFKTSSSTLDRFGGYTNSLIKDKETEKFNLQDILKQFKTNITNILKEPNLIFNTGIRAENLFAGSISPFRTQRLESFSKSDDIQLQLLSKLFTSVIDAKGFNEEEANAFIELVFLDCGANRDNSFQILSLTMEDFIKLDKNGDGNWFDELSNIINKVAARYSHMEQSEIDSAETIDAEQFIREFGSNGSTDTTMVDKIVMQLNEMTLSDDPAMRKLAQILNKAFEKYNCQYADEKKDLVKWFLNITAKKCGHEDTRYYLTKEDIETLNVQDIFSNFEEILDSHELYYAYMVNSDGELGDFKQGSTGDCWLIAALIELKNSLYGREIIREAIKHNDDGSVTVTFKGVNVSYTLSPEEIIEADQGPAYSGGDNDVLILELATEKLRRDIASGKVKVSEEYSYTTPKGENHSNSDDNTSNDHYDDGKAGSGIWGGWQSQMLYFLTGYKSNKVCVGTTRSEDIRNSCLKLLSEFQAGKVVLSLSFGGGAYSAPCTDGEIFFISITNGHAFAITGMTDETITIINPWNSSISYTFTWEEFAKLRFDSIDATRIA